MHGRPQRTGSKGQALLELALIAPLLLLILLGTLDLGRVFYYQMAVTNAAREAAIYASRDPTDTAGIRARAQSEAAPVNILSADVRVTTPGGVTPGNPIQVAVVYRFRSVTPLVGQIWGGGDLLIEGAATMVIQ